MQAIKEYRALFTGLWFKNSGLLVNGYFGYRTIIPECTLSVLSHAVRFIQDYNLERRTWFTIRTCSLKQGYIRFTIRTCSLLQEYIRFTIRTCSLIHEYIRFTIRTCSLIRGYLMFTIRTCSLIIQEYLRFPQDVFLNTRTFNVYHRDAFLNKGYYRFTIRTCSLIQEYLRFTIMTGSLQRIYIKQRLTGQWTCFLNLASGVNIFLKNPPPLLKRIFPPEILCCYLRVY